MAVTNKIKQKLALAAGALLGEQATAAETTENIELYNSWNVDVGYLFYQESDYITVDTFMAMIDGNLSDKDTVKLGVVFDTLTGSTPTGALPGNGSVTVTGVSGGGGFSAGSAGGTVPFDDTRLAINGTWGHEWQRLIRSNVSTYVSVEGDYTAVGGGIGIEKDSEDKAYTYSAAIGASADKVSQSNEQTPVPLSELDDQLYVGTGSKNTYDFLLGVTKIINQRTAAMLNFSYSTSLGYHTDPYKIISVADAQDSEFTVLFEKRPDERERFALYSKLVHELPNSGDHFNISYRYYQDSWELSSHTVESSYSFELNSKSLLEPFGRIYQQQAANFYQRTILSTDGNLSNLPEFVSSDPRLGEMLNITAGLKYQYKTSSTGSVDFRLAYISRQFTDAVVEGRDAIFFTVDLGKGFD